MKKNIYNVPFELDALLENVFRDKGKSNSEKELIKFSMWVASQQELPDTLVMIISPLLDAMVSFVEENYTWNGTRTYTVETDR